MRHEKKWLRSAGLLVAVGLAVAACGGETAEEGPGEEPAEESTEEEADSEESAAAADTEEVASPLAGETITFSVPRGEGAGFDLYARMLVPYLEEELDASFVVSNEPGAGGMIALNQTWAGPTDGTRIQIVPLTPAMMQQLSDDAEAQFDLTEMSWVGRLVGEPQLMITSADHGLETVEDLIDHAEENGEITFVSTGVLNPHTISALVFEQIFDVPVRVVAGFDSTNDAFASVLRGEAQVMLSSVGTAVEHRNAGEAFLPLTISMERSDLADDVPSISDYEELLDDNSRGLVEVTDALHVASRSIVAPPNTDPDALAALRAALEATLANPDFQAEADENNRPMSWASGEEVASIIDGALGEPPQAYLDLIDEAFERAS